MPCIVICLCFFHCPVHPRALHSFPTRRSSDLDPAQEEAALLVAPPRIVLWRITLPQTLSFLAATGRSAAARRDRKSTRLNSSHRCISYAVFCLKKKKKKKKKETTILIKESKIR